jgi:hypothetical protein
LKYSGFPNGVQTRRDPVEARGQSMKSLLVLVAVLYSAAAFAQGTPPMVGGKPLLQVKPKAAKTTVAKPKSMAVRLQACLDIEDGTKGRLDCYDAVIPPQPKAKAPAAKAVMDCRFAKEEDERLACFNGFVERIPKLPAT